MFEPIVAASGLITQVSQDKLNEFSVVAASFSVVAASGGQGGSRRSAPDSSFRL